MIILPAVFVFSGCALQPAKPYPKYDTGGVGLVEIDEEAPDSGADPDDSDTSQADSRTDTDTGPTDPNAIEIYGTYAGLTGEYHYIRENYYQIDFGVTEKLYNFVVFNNAQRWLVAGNDSGNGAEESGKFSKFVWTIDANSIVWVCQATSTAESTTEAQNAPFPSVVNMETGCNGAAWWRLTRQ